MAKPIGDLPAASGIGANDKFVLEQSGIAKSLTGQILLNWLTAAADGHGGIQSIDKISTSGLVDTYRITLADTTIFDLPVTNGRSITDVSKTGTSGLVDTYTIYYNDGTTSTFAVKNGEKGDKGDNTYTWIKYASQEPTEASHSMGDIPDDWRGEYNGPLSSPPTDWKSYKWYKIKGEQGDTGAPATLYSQSVTYQVGDSGSIIPSGAWSNSVPVVPQGKYLWTKTDLKFNSGDPIISYSVARMGIDGSGSVSSVCNKSPDESGNVPLTAEDVGARPNTWMPTAEDVGARPDTWMPTAADVGAATPEQMNDAVRKATQRNLLDNSDFRNPVNQRGRTSYGSNDGYTVDRWYLSGHVNALTLNEGYITLAATSGGDAWLTQKIENKVIFGKKLTFAVKIKDGPLLVASGLYPVGAPTASTEIASAVSGDCRIAIKAYVDAAALLILTGPGSNVNVECAALYDGEYTDETLPEYQPKGYAAELLECQRYYQIRSTNSVLAVDMRPTMRLNNPTITSVTNGYAYSADF